MKVRFPQHVTSRAELGNILKEMRDCYREADLNAGDMWANEARGILEAYIAHHRDAVMAHYRAMEQASLLKGDSK